MRSFAIAQVDNAYGVSREGRVVKNLVLILTILSDSKIKLIRITEC